MCNVQRAEYFNAKTAAGGGLEPYIALAIWEVGDSLLALLNCSCCYRQGCFLVSLPGTRFDLAAQ